MCMGLPNHTVQPRRLLQNLNQRVPCHGPEHPPLELLYYLEHRCHHQQLISKMLVSVCDSVPPGPVSVPHVQLALWHLKDTATIGSSWSMVCSFAPEVGPPSSTGINKLGFKHFTDSRVCCSCTRKLSCGSDVKGPFT